MLVYKLTDRKGQSYAGTQWGENVEHSASATGPLCSAGWLHCYTDPLLAVLLNPIHANYQPALLWEAEGEGRTMDDYQLKLGVERLRTLRQIALPAVTTEQRVRFGILCALSVHEEARFRAWAERWLSGEDRTAVAAEWAARADALNLAALARQACGMEA